MKALIVALIVSFPIVSHAFPIAPFNALEVSIIHQNGDNQNYDFEGIVKLSNCSGSIVRFSGQPDSAKAYVLTNGHCVKRWGFLKPGEVWYNKPINRTMKVSDKNLRFHSIRATKAIYATMTNTDAALYQLQESYTDLSRLGIEAFYFSSQHPLMGTDIEIVSGYWERGYKCHIDGFVYQLKEADWTFTDSIRYSPSGCEVVGGTSGSPIIESGSRTVVGINNTGNESGQRCRMNNPCEVDDNGRVTVKKGINYGQQTFNFYDCLTPDFKIDLSMSTCSLPQ